MGFRLNQDQPSRMSTVCLVCVAELSRRFNLDLEIASRARSDLTDETQYVFSARSVRAVHSNYYSCSSSSSPPSYTSSGLLLGEDLRYAAPRESVH